MFFGSFIFIGLAEPRFSSIHFDPSPGAKANLPSSVALLNVMYYVYGDLGHGNIVEVRFQEKFYFFFEGGESPFPIAHA